MKTRTLAVISLILAVCFSLFGCDGISETNTPVSDSVATENGSFSDAETTDTPTSDEEPGTQISGGQDSSPAVNFSAVSLSDIPPYSGSPYVSINGGEPSFTESDLTTESYEYYSPLDSLGRCGVTVACVGKDLMPTEERGNIGQVKPTGWHTVKYDCVDGNYLYNRCHLIGYQLSGENANTANLITGTRYMNVEGMLPFENMVADYVKETGNHVLYRVTPIFDGDNLLASGVQMEAYSVEDGGDGICFNVYVYNAQPEIAINYATGESSYVGSASNDIQTEPQTEMNAEQSVTYILNKNTKKFHYPSCHSAEKIKESNKGTYTGDCDDLIEQGYEPCKNCDP